jgi:hypothetical protein
VRVRRVRLEVRLEVRVTVRVRVRRIRKSSSKSK